MQGRGRVVCFVNFFRAMPLGLSLSAHAALAIALWMRGESRMGRNLHAEGTRGDTFDLPAPELADAMGLGAPSVAEPRREVREDARGEGPKPLVATRSRTARSRGAAPDASHAQPGSSSIYGAVGDRAAVDLATAFTRGFPHASSEDPAWRSAPLGAAGEAEIVLVLDDSGHLESTRVKGSPSPALASGIRRTLALVAGRTFTARLKATTLRISATVSRDTVHDGLHGDVFAIGGSFASGEGQAFFALAIGRRIDLRVRAD